jgi:hypothetical protein
VVKVRLGYADAIRARFIVLVLVRLLRVVNVTRTKIGRNGNRDDSFVRFALGEEFGAG